MLGKASNPQADKSSTPAAPSGRSTASSASSPRAPISLQASTCDRLYNVALAKVLRGILQVGLAPFVVTLRDRPVSCVCRCCIASMPAYLAKGCCSGLPLRTSCRSRRSLPSSAGRSCKQSQQGAVYHGTHCLLYRACTDCLTAAICWCCCSLSKACNCLLAHLDVVLAEVQRRQLRLPHQVARNRVKLAVAQIH